MRDQRRLVVVAATVILAGFVGLLLAERSGLLLDHGAGDRRRVPIRIGGALPRAALRKRSVAARLSSMAQCGAYLIAAAGPFVMGFLHGHTWLGRPILFLIVATLVGLAVGYAAGKDRLIRD